VQLAQLLHTREQSAPHGQTVRCTSNDYNDRLKPVRAIRKIKAGRSALQGRMVRDVTTWNNRAMVSQSNSSGLSAIHGRTVRTWTTYRSAKNPRRSVVQGHKSTPSLPKLNSSYADGPTSWLGRSVKGDRERLPADLSGRVADGPTFWPRAPNGPPTTEKKFCASSKEF
jgi:hypothetical protein